MNKQKIKASKTFYYLHKKDYEEIERFVENRDRNFFMNPYYNMTVEQIAWYVANFNNLTEVKKDLYYDYKPEYASAWFENIIYVLGGK